MCMCDYVIWDKIVILDMIDVKCVKLQWEIALNRMSVSDEFSGTIFKRTHRKRVRKCMVRQKPVTTMSSRVTKYAKRLNVWKILCLLTLLHIRYFNTNRVILWYTYAYSHWPPLTGSGRYVRFDSNRFALVAFRVTYAICFAFGTKNNNILMTWMSMSV